MENLAPVKLLHQARKNLASGGGLDIDELRNLSKEAAQIKKDADTIIPLLQALLLGLGKLKVPAEDEPEEEKKEEKEPTKLPNAVVANLKK